MKRGEGKRGWPAALLPRSSAAKHAKREAARAALKSSVRSLTRLACESRGWPKLLWREGLPQHFGASGEFKKGSSCQPLREQAARRFHSQWVAPPLQEIAASHSQHSCIKAVETIRSFWPLVPLHEDHTRLTNGGKGKPADCTHWLPCSSAMYIQLQLLIGGILELGGTHDGQRNEQKQAPKRSRGVS